MALLTKDNLEFYETEIFKNIEQSVIFKNKPNILSFFDDIFLLIGIGNKVEIYYYKNKILKS